MAQRPTAWIARLTLATIAATTIVSGQTQNPAQTPQTPQTPTAQPGTVFRATANNITETLLARDAKGQFVPDLRADEVQVYEDGVLQKISVFLPVIGGRPMGSVATAAPPPAATGGLILPRTVPPPDTSGRIFIVFIDDLHLQANMTPQDEGPAEADPRHPRQRQRPGRIRLERLLVDRERHPVRLPAQALRRGDQEDHGRRADDGRDHQGAGQSGRAGRHAVSRARRVRHGARYSQAGREDHESPQVLPLHQQRLRLQSVQGLAPEVSTGSVLGSRQVGPQQSNRSRARTRTTTTIRSRNRASSLPRRIWSPSSPS